MLTDWESWTEPVFNAIRLQKETKLEITLKWDIAEQPRKAPMTEHCLKEKKKKKSSYFNKTYERKYKTKSMKEASNPQRASDTAVCN